MTTSTTIRPTPPARAHLRGRIGGFLAVLLAVSTFLAATLTWTDHYVFNAERFATRADKALESYEVRAVLAGQITNAVINSGSSELASFRAVIQPAVTELIGTREFKRIFRRALVEAHNYLFTRDGNAAIVNLSQALGILTSSLQLTNPGVVSLLPSTTDTFLVDLGNRIQGLKLWKISRTVSDFGWAALALTLVLAIGTVVVDTDRRRGTFRLGLAAAAAGLMVVVCSLVVPLVAQSYVGDPTLGFSIEKIVEVFIADYRLGGMWLIAIGALVAAFATVSRPSHAPVTLRGLATSIGHQIARFVPDDRRGSVVKGLALMAAGVVTLIWTGVVRELLEVAVAGTLFYLGSVRLLLVVGRTAAPGVPAMADATDGTGDHPPAETVWRPRLVRVAIGGAVVMGLTIAVGLWATNDARVRAEVNDERQCNGFAALCNRRLDEVAFAGTHNAMSTSTDAGWLFFEQGRSIPAQLDSGIRALLVKTHYGIPTNIRVTGTDLVVTDKAAELYVDATTGGAEPTQAQKEALARSTEAARNLDPNLRDVYLCHVNCEFGATRFATALEYVRRFLVRNPDEVVILFVGNYVADADTDKAFRDAGLFDRLWNYDPSAPMPTLAELIDSRRNVIYMGEFTTRNPARPWDVPGYGIVQDNPFTFRTVDELLTPGAPGYTGSATVSGAVPDTIVPPGGGPAVFSPDWTGLPSCRPNRGSPESPLFQINHWVTPAGAPPTVAQARVVNSYAVLSPAVRNCMTQRNRFPSIIGVNFAETGDLFRVVNELNGVG